MDDELQLSSRDQEKESLKRTSRKQSGLIKEVIDEIHFVKSSPEEYLKKLKEFRKNISAKDNSIQTFNQEILIIEEVEHQYEGLLKLLTNLEPLEALIENEFLNKSTEEFIATLQKYEKKEETIIANYIIDLSNRLKKNGIINGAIGEIIDVGVIDNAELIVLKLLLDDKDDKSERNLILNEKIRYIGGSYFDFNYLIIQFFY